MGICVMCQRTVVIDAEHPWHVCNDIKRQLNELDLRVIRAMLENDNKRIKEIVAQKEVLRKQLPPEV